MRSLGETETYDASQVRRIVAYGGKGNDFVYVDRRVNAELDFDGGAGNDGFMILGGAAGSQIRGGAGKDEFVGGTRSGLYFWGGDGNDRFIGGEGAEFIDMGAGENTIFGGGGNDVIRVNGTLDTVDAGAGDDLITTTLAGVLNLIGGTGNDRLVLDNFTSTAPIQLNQHALVVTSGADLVRSVSFDDSLDQVSLNDSAAVTALRSGTNASWGQVDLVLDAAGVLDVTQARLVAPQALFSVSAAGINGTLNTELAELSVVQPRHGRRVHRRHRRARGRQPDPADGRPGQWWPVHAQRPHRRGPGWPRGPADAGVRRHQHRHGRWRHHHRRRRCGLRFRQQQGHLHRCADPAHPGHGAELPSGQRRAIGLRRGQLAGRCIRAIST